MKKNDDKKIFLFKPIFGRNSSKSARKWTSERTPSGCRPIKRNNSAYLGSVAEWIRAQFSIKFEDVIFGIYDDKIK